MKIAILNLSVLCLMACDASTAQNPSDKTELAAEVHADAADVLARKGPSWVIEYSGDLEGTMKGGVMSITSVSRTVVAAGKAMKPDNTGSATQAMSLTITTYGDKPSGRLKLTLADGTECSESTSREHPQSSTVNVVDPDRKTFKAEASGTLSCGQTRDKTVTYTAKLSKG